mmetsp:Transcript_39924/g.82126  ORF Transcript_39924/g.82126 Transcript_39924/m.82126 type:complete len:253 (+) Transcript_39924:52-810(+)
MLYSGQSEHGTWSEETMGRSQVERNRMRGRPGSRKGGGRGRGGGRQGRGSSGGRGGGSAAAASRNQDLGSNAWRYEEDDDRDNNDGDATNQNFGDDYDVDAIVNSTSVHYVEHGASHHDVASDLFGDGADAQLLSSPSPANTIDLNALAETLRKVPTAKLLNLPQHLADLYDAKYGGSVGGGGSRPKAKDELRVVKPGTEEKDAQKEKASALDAAREASADDSSKEEKNAIASQDGEEEEEDLDAWLDSVIS